MKKLCIYIMMILPLVISARAYQVISESRDELVVRFELPEWSLEHVKINGQEWQRIVSADGAISSEAGYPQIISFGEAVGVPHDGDIFIQVTDYRSTKLHNINLIPVSRIHSPKEYEVEEIFEPNPLIYKSSAVFPAELASKGELKFVGDRSFITAQINPFRYRPAMRELEVVSEMTLRIRISGTKSPSRDWMTTSNFIDAVADKFFLNDQSSRQWRLPRMRDNSYVAPRSGSGMSDQIQIVVDSPGIYRITYQYLADVITSAYLDQGLELSWDLDTIDPRYLELRGNNGPVPIHLAGESDGSFDSGDYFEFWGDRNYGTTSYYDDFTLENVYLLAIGPSLGARMAIENGGLVVSNPTHFIVPTAYKETVHFEQQNIYEKLGNAWSPTSYFYREDIWFWKTISAPNLEITPIYLQYPIATAARRFDIRVGLFGRTFARTLGPNQFDHNATVRINQSLVNSHTWIGQTEKIFENAAPIPNTFLNHGENSVFISLPGDTVSGSHEQVMLDFVNITYWREYKTETDYIKFTKPADRPMGLYQFTLEGFTNANVSVYKIGSSVFNSVQIEPFAVDALEPWVVTFQDSVNANDIWYYAVTDAQKKQPRFARLLAVSDLRNPQNAADLIAISNSTLIASEGTMMMKQVWEDKGYTVRLVDIQHVFNEFNFGIRSADALKEFIRYVYNNWSEPYLKQVIFIGEGTNDERDNSPAKAFNIIPVKKLWTVEQGATPSDSWYACIVGADMVPDISLGRITAWREEQVYNYARKVVHYHENALTNLLWHSHITYTSGGKGADGTDIFAQESELIKRRAIPTDYRVARVYTNTSTVGSQYAGGTTALKDRINAGTSYVQFNGHGGGMVWSDYNLFSFNDVVSLNNQVYPIFISLACYAAAFDTRGIGSLGEQLVLRPDQGGISTIGHVAYSYSGHNLTYGVALNIALLDDRFSSVGESFTFAQARFSSAGTAAIARRSYTVGMVYLGDPTIELRKPQRGIEVIPDKYVYNPGDTLRVSAIFPSGVNLARLFVLDQKEIIVNIPFDIPVIQNQFQAQYVLPVNAGNSYNRKVLVVGYSAQQEYLGMTQISVGRPNIMHYELIPGVPTWKDSVRFSARVWSPSNVISVYSRVRTDSIGANVTWQNLEMQPTRSDPDVYTTIGKLNRQNTGKEIVYKYVIETDSHTYESPLHSYLVAGPDLMLYDIGLKPTNGQIAVEVLVRNGGNSPSITTDLKLYWTPPGQSIYTLYKTQDIAPLEIDAQRWETILLDIPLHANVTLQAKVNESAAFPEWHNSFSLNNVITMTIPLNYHFIGSAGGVINSIDGNVSVEIPENLISGGQTSLFYVNDQTAPIANGQPDIEHVKLLSGTQSNVYDIRTLDSSLVDSTGVFVNGKILRLTFSYHPTDEQTQMHEGEDSYKIYRWDEYFRKWINQGGFITTVENKVVYEVNQQGIYALLRNKDRVRPSIDVNVQDQEFTVGGYISSQGTISLLLSDSNGIDVIDSSIRLFLNGAVVAPEHWTMTLNSDNLNRIPIKYQLNLSRGTYYLVIDCRDVNGNFNTREVQFFVSDTFDVIRIANYPNPVVGRAQDPKNDGRTRFTYVLTDDADEVTIKVYTVSGRLVRTFRNLPVGVGYHEFPRTVYGWDCKDDQGFRLANGVYFYKIIARKGNKTVEKIQKMAILK